jgi:hypothetical protein
VEDYTKEDLLEELHDEELHDEEPEESEDDPPDHLDAEEIEEMIDTLTERLATLSHNDIDDLNYFDDFGSEKEDEVGAVDLENGARGLNKQKKLKTKIMNIQIDRRAPSSTSQPLARYSP